MPAGEHTPVLLRECLDLLAPAPGDLVIDCTAGLGGHAVELAKRIGPYGAMLLVDLDRGNLDHASARVRALPESQRPARLHAFHASFASVPRAVVELGWGEANVVLADLGFASPQVADAQRGFSFSRDGPLDMRLDQTAPVTAAEIVNTLSERELAERIAELAEEPMPAARAIARNLVRARAASPITNTARLAEVVRAALPPRRPGQSPIDPATRTFQAIRIMVNDELGSLDGLLAAVQRQAAVNAASGSAGARWLARGARIGVISFHSLEDRRVKRVFSEIASSDLGTLSTRKPVEAGEDERAANPRSRSAKLRVLRLSQGRGPLAADDDSPRDGSRTPG
jgi:16S rRNA (cytosine1402-N4)-methyltransferase